MKTSKTHILADERGTAMSEALILAMFFVFVGIAIMHMYSMFNAKLKTYSDVRGCAWAYANGGCQALPPYCKGAATNPGLSPVGLDDWTQGQGKEFFGKDEAKMVSDGLGFAHDVMDKLNILGKSTSVTKASDPVKRHALLGGGDFTPGASYAVFCNEPYYENNTMAEEAFCRIVNGKIPGCERR